MVSHVGWPFERITELWILLVARGLGAQFGVTRRVLPAAS